MTTSEIDQRPAVDSESLPELVSRSEAARLLGVHDDTIYRWARRGLLNPIKLPSGIARYRTSELLAIKAGNNHGAS